VATCSGATNWEAAFVAAILLLHPAYWKMENEAQS